MSVQQFCLRWNNHQPNFISVCSSLLHNGTLVDVTLAAEGRQLQAHKIVLSACSSYFQTLFTTNPCQHPIVILKDVQYDDLKTMVDFMYYGEVNVSQEQLPHILKTAEMLKIKGLAEMPTDPANLTKSADCKSVGEPTELIGNSGGITTSQGGGGNGGNLGSSTSGSVNDSLWGSTDSQFQQQQHHHHQQQLQQQQQQQHHHHQQTHHQQQTQNSQTQINQHHQLRRTPSPLGAGASPATRRKRLRKSSNNGSGDRNSSEDQHVGSLDTPSNATGGLSLAQMSQMSFSASANSLGGLGGHLHSSKLLKESTSSELEQHPHDSDSLDDGQGHVHMQIKPEVDISGVQQTMPLDISGTTTPSEHDAPNSQSSHADLTTTTTTMIRTSPAIASTYTAVEGQSVKALETSTPTNLTNLHSQSQQSHSQQLQQASAPMGTKRNRVLTRQPRVKRDSDSLSNNQISPEPNSNIEFDPFGSQSPSNTHAYHHRHPNFLTVPPRIERHSSEPAPAPSSPHLLSVPQTTPFLIKQHSDPLLPSQHHAAMSGSSTAIHIGGTNPFAPLHRQYSHPLPGSHIASAPLHHSHHISLPESIYASSSPPLTGSSQYIVPQSSVTVASAAAQTSTTNSPPVTTESTTSSTVATSTKALSLPQFTTTYIGCDSVGRSRHSISPPTNLQISSERCIPPDGSSGTIPGIKLSSSKSASAVLLSDRNSLHPGSAQAISSSSFEHLPTLRVRNEELQRSVSSPQTTREIITLENPRSSHCPVIRPGPALGCNFCWNTIDGHGRILRRKTKYHCPECQTNLCIVPCFQEYHERLNNEGTTAAPSASSASSSSSTANTATTATHVSGASTTSTNNSVSIMAATENAKHGMSSATAAAASAASLITSSSSSTRHYTKTESI